jgi:hypothetical protein
VGIGLGIQFYQVVFLFETAEVMRNFVENGWEVAVAYCPACRVLRADHGWFTGRPPSRCEPINEKTTEGIRDPVVLPGIPAPEPEELSSWNPPGLARL